MALPLRPKQHINSTKSIKKFQLELPDEWVIREINQDYGIDFEIEIWKDNSLSGKNKFTPSGRSCLIQLKDKEKFDYLEAEIGYSLLQMKVSTINYLYLKPNSFIVLNIHSDHFSIIRAKELKEILIDKIIKPKGKKVTIPIINRRPTWTSTKYSYWLSGLNSHKFYALLGDNKKSASQFEIPYLNYFDSESAFWKKETYANIGLYYSTKTKHKPIIAILKELFIKEDRWGKLGILEAFEYLKYRDADTLSYSNKIIDSENPLEVILGLYFSAMPNEDNNIDIIDGYSNNPNSSKAILNFDEQESIEYAAIKAFQVINTEKSFSYILGSFLSDNWLVKNSLRYFIGKIILEMVNSNKVFYEIAQKRFKEKFPNSNLFDNSKIETIITGIVDILKYDK
jgi:hypothetical protein